MRILVGASAPAFHERIVDVPGSGGGILSEMTGSGVVVVGGGMLELVGIGVERRFFRASHFDEYGYFSAFCWEERFVNFFLGGNGWLKMFLMVDKLFRRLWWRRRVRQ